MRPLNKKKPRPLLTASEAAEYLRVSKDTLWRIEKTGKLIPFRTPGRHRRYSIAMLNAYLEGTKIKHGKGGNNELARGT